MRAEKAAESAGGQHRGRLASLIGRSRGERLLSIGTVAVVLVAVISVVVLRSGGEEGSEGRVEGATATAAELIAVDRACLRMKRTILSTVADGIAARDLRRSIRVARGFGSELRSHGRFQSQTTSGELDSLAGSAFALAAALRRLEARLGGGDDAEFQRSIEGVNGIAALVDDQTRAAGLNACAAVKLVAS